MGKRHKSKQTETSKEVKKKYISLFFPLGTSKTPVIMCETNIGKLKSGEKKADQSETLGLAGNNTVEILWLFFVSQTPPDVVGARNLERTTDTDQKIAPTKAGSL